MNEHNEGGRLPDSSLAAAILIAAVWGFNFTVIKVGVAGVPPLFLAFLRFALSAFPAILFVRRPRGSWLPLAAYGLLLGVGQFGLLFTAIKRGAPAGLSSIMLQSQAFFTAIIAAAVLKEKIRPTSVAGMIAAAAGLALIGLSGSGLGGGSAVPLLVMVPLAAFFWACTNIIARRMPGTGGLALVVWSSLFSPLPLLALSLWLEGPSAIGSALSALRPVSVGALAYLVIGSTLFGYGVWNRLIMKHGAGRIAPFSLLVPVFGVSAASLAIGEPFSAADAAASALVVGGLALHAFGGRRCFGGKRPFGVRRRA